MFREARKEVTRRFFGRIFEDLIGYWKIYDSLKLKSITLIDKPIEINEESEFWYYILGDRFAGEKPKNFIPLYRGQVLKLKDFFISEWAPKMPGQLWTIKGATDLEKAESNIERFANINGETYWVLNPDDKKRVILAGYGSIRLSPHVNDSDYCMYLSLVSKQSWHSDYGIPLVVSKSVYQEFCKYSSVGAPWIESLEGVLHFKEDLPFNTIIPNAIGTTLSKEVEESLRYRPFLPKCFLYVSSPLSIRLRYNDSHPTCVAWTMFETKLKKEPYRYTYTYFNPKQADSINKAVSFINWYVKNYEGKRIITDFDGIEPKLASDLPPNKNLVKNKKGKKELGTIIRKIDDWIKIVS